MATESIGTLIPTAIPGYTDSADIQAALRAYHYGSYSYDPANTSPGSLVTPSIAKTIYDIEQDIISLENRPSSGGEVNATEPVPGDFTPPSIPDGFIWVDSDGSTGNGPYSATSVFTNSAPTANLTTGVIWVDKDPTSITVNPFIPQTIIGAKGDIVVGTANDTASVLSAGTNGFVLSANSATTSGLEWVANDVGDITGVTAGVGISGGGTSGAVTITNDMATTITTNGDLIYGTGSGTYTRRGIGSSGQVLTVSGGAPTWATPTPGGMTLITTTSFSGATTANIDNIFSSTYNAYKVIITKWNAGGNTLVLRLRYGSTTYTNANYYGSSTGMNSNGTVNTQLASAATSQTLGFDGQTGQSVCDLTFFDVGTSAIQPAWTGIWMGHGNYNQLIGGQLNANFQIITGIQLLSASGNVSGTVSVYGLAK
jgi:hypothetical protein